MPEAGGGRGKASDSNSRESNRQAGGQVRHDPEEHGRSTQRGGGWTAAQSRLLPRQAGPGEGRAHRQGGTAAEADCQGGAGDRGPGEGDPTHEDFQFRLQIRECPVRRFFLLVGLHFSRN